ncbi:MAG: PDZ domain-containing protein, partial [Planctomycetes bacterium]|nr:PDZ domain-containing protein [Planctomycetota bacterium]
NNVGYAISVDHVRRQLTGLLMQPYKLRSVDLGLRVLDDEQGVVVMDVHPEGPAARAGVRSGDRISSLAGVAITWSPGFARTLLAQQARAPVELVVTRDGERLVFPITPLPPETFSVLRQCGLETRDFSYVEDPERVRKAAIGLYRAYTGVATGEPRVIPSGVVEVVRASRFDGRAPQVQPGDLILAVELRGAGGAPALTPIETVAQLRDLFNDRVRGKTEDVDHYKVAAEYPVWIARGGEVLKVTVAAVRLLP